VGGHSTGTLTIGLSLGWSMNALTICTHRENEVLTTIALLVTHPAQLSEGEPFRLLTVQNFYAISQSPVVTRG
jgi:hypothetical protein